MELCGINISCLHHEDIFSITQKPKLVVTVNAEAIVRSQTDPRLKSIINNNSSTIDGQIPLWLYRRKYKKKDIEKISGSDLIFSIPEFAEKHDLKVFLLGGKEDSNDGSIKILRKKHPKLEIEGFSPPYSPYPFSDQHNNVILNKLAQFKPEILFVGFGMGKQEFWEEDNLDFLENIGVKLIIGCGGSFEFASGIIKRAPLFIQNIGLEGIWRLFQEFKWYRFKRILLSLKIFYYYAIDRNINS